ncbi:MAG: hypothetical protein ACR2QT_03550 [Woeseiaceae bacterium]
MKAWFSWFEKILSKNEDTAFEKSDADTSISAADELEKGVLLPDLSALATDEVTVPNLRVLDPPTGNENESPGFNPYDTGVIQKD